MKILVTGAFGLLGCSLQKEFFQQGLTSQHDIVYLSRTDCDLRDYTQVYSLFERHSPNIVIHLASCVGGVFDNMENNYIYLMDNIKINCNIVQACNEFRVKKLINILSTCIFPDKGVSYPLTSDQLHNGLPHSSNVGYAYSKRILQVTSNVLANTSKSSMQVVNLIPTNLYGENDNYNIQRAHVIPALIHKTYKAMTEETPLYVKGTGNAVRQFLYVDDLARVIIHFTFNNNKESEVSCIVSPPEHHEINIRSLVTMICDIFKFKGDVIYESEYQSDGQIKKTTTSSELLQYIPTFEFTTLHQGLTNTITFFNRSYNKIIRK
jgi:GDP-L-fucose synthase